MPKFEVQKVAMKKLSTTDSDMSRMVTPFHVFRNFERICGELYRARYSSG